MDTIVPQAVTEESGTALSTPVKVRVATGVRAVTATRHRPGHVRFAVICELAAAISGG